MKQLTMTMIVVAVLGGGRAWAQEELCSGTPFPEQFCAWTTHDCDQGPPTGEIDEDGILFDWGTFQGTYWQLGSDLDNKISSLNVGSGAELRVCTDPSWGGSCLYLGEGCQNLTGIFDNAVTSIRIDRLSEPCWTGQNPSRQTVYLYENPGTPADGDCNARTVNESIGGQRLYDHAGWMGLKDNTLSSVRVGIGTTVVLYRDPNETGAVSCTSSGLPALNLDLAGSIVGDNSVSSMEMGTSSSGCGTLNF